MGKRSLESVGRLKTFIGDEELKCRYYYCLRLMRSDDRLYTHILSLSKLDAEISLMDGGRRHLSLVRGSSVIKTVGVFSCGMNEFISVKSKLR